MKNIILHSISMGKCCIDDTGLPVVTVMPSSKSVEVTRTAKFTAMVTGVGPFTYQWRHNKTIIRGLIGDTLIRNVAPDSAGVYNCTVMNQYGNSDSSLASLIVTGMHKFSRFSVKDTL